MVEKFPYIENYREIDFEKLEKHINVIFMVKIFMIIYNHILEKIMIMVMNKLVNI